jgi:hypothetical protein
MTLVEFDGLLAEMIRRLRLARAAAAVFRLAAGTLLVLSAAVLAAKLLPAERSWFWTGGAVLAAALVVLGAFAAAWLGRPVSRLAAAAEVDRVAALKERASSLVAARAGSAPRTAAFAELERDAAAALAPLAREALLRAALPALPARARWLVGLGALALGALLVPARAPRGAEDLAALLADGGALVQALESGGAAGAPEGAPQSRVASKVLSILKGPPPADPEGAQRQRKDLRELAAELRKSGKPGDQAVARRIDELADQLARLAGPAAPEGAADAEPPRGDGGRAGRGAYLRSHPEYAELLARYFGPAGG